MFTIPPGTDLTANNDGPTMDIPGVNLTLYEGCPPGYVVFICDGVFLLVSTQSGCPGQFKESEA